MSFKENSAIVGYGDGIGVCVSVFLFLFFIENVCQLMV